MDTVNGEAMSTQMVDNSLKSDHPHNGLRQILRARGPETEPMDSVLLVDSDDGSLASNSAASPARFGKPNPQGELLFNKSLRDLPAEILAQIAGQLDMKDLRSFGAICRETVNAVRDVSSPLWRCQFISNFDLIPNASNAALRSVLLYRFKMLCRLIKFKKGTEQSEKQCLSVLKDLVNESYASSKTLVLDSNGNQSCQNLARVKEFVKRTDILKNALRLDCLDRFTNKELIAIQVVLSHLRFDIDLYSPTYAYPDSRLAAYSLPHAEPFFFGRDRSEVNLLFTLRLLNFWRYHLMEEKVYTLHRAYRESKASDRVRPWRSALKNGVQQIGRKWRGAYAYVEIDELEDMRDSAGSRDPEPVEDRWSDNWNNEFQTLDLECVDPKEANDVIKFPTNFECHLRSTTHPSLNALVRAIETGKMPKSRTGNLKGQNTRRSSTDHCAPLPFDSPNSPESFLSPDRHPISQHALSTLRKRKRESGEDERDGLSDDSVSTSDSPSSQSRSSPQYSKEDQSELILPRIIHIRGKGVDEDGFVSAGFLTPLPSQRGYHGFQRFTMVKMFVPKGDHNDPSDPFTFVPLDKGGAKQYDKIWDSQYVDWLDIMEQGDIWAYEGLVLPGAQIMIGRWWRVDPDKPGAGIALSNEAYLKGVKHGVDMTSQERHNATELYSGPFIFWCVDP